MAIHYIDALEKGKKVVIPAVKIDGQTFITRGAWFKLVSVRDEDLVPGELVPNPEALIQKLKKSGLKADVLTFFQRPPNERPKFSYPIEWENYAVVPVTTFEAWWDKLPQESRKNTRRAAKRGVEVKVVSFNDELARGIHTICNETPVRQGKPFWHYGKDFETVRSDFSNYPERSEFIGAYFAGELIGFIKLIYVDQLAFIVAILALNAHHDKRPMNAMLAKAVEICVQKHVPFFVYGNYIYGNKKDSSLAEFKRRNGFEQVNFPRYYIPLTWKGRIYAVLRLHRGAVGLLPAPVLDLLLKIRDKFYEPAGKVKAATLDSAKDE